MSWKGAGEGGDWGQGFSKPLAGGLENPRGKLVKLGKLLHISKKELSSFLYFPLLEGFTSFPSFTSLQSMPPRPLGNPAPPSPGSDTVSLLGANPCRAKSDLIELGSSCMKKQVVQVIRLSAKTRAFEHLITRCEGRDGVVGLNQNEECLPGHNRLHLSQ